MNPFCVWLDNGNLRTFRTLARARNCARKNRPATVGFRDKYDGEYHEWERFPKGGDCLDASQTVRIAGE